ncbi:hypothetical protein ACHAW5_005054 [Stephanodiscus triporus]|uniref:Uncharacterized protein n=1 Tax=Stephanodiscus triporus TaxID=2934178 RepID=A0ABD3NAH1_9STRA
MRNNQETCIKELGKKLIRQAHVIKRQSEELDMRDKRDALRLEDVRRLEGLLENSRDRHEQMEAMLDRVARDQAKKTERICELEQVLEDKAFKVESVTNSWMRARNSLSPRGSS